MMRKLSSSRNLREALTSTKGSYPWNVLTVEGLEFFLESVLTQKKEDSDDEEPCCHKKYQKNKTIYKKKFQKNKKKLYSKEDSEDDEISEDVEVLFMGFESEIPKEEIEDVVDLGAELINAHEELEKYKRMYKK